MSKSHRMLAAGNMPRGSTEPGSREELLYALECYLAGQCTPTAGTLISRMQSWCREHGIDDYILDIEYVIGDTLQDHAMIERARDLLREMGEMKK